MNFENTDERRMLQENLRRYLAAAPADIWSGLAEMGIIGALFDEAHGGYGGKGLDLAVVFEELGRADVQVPLIDTALVPGRLLCAAGHGVGDLIGGKARYAFAHSEVASRYDLDWIETRAEGNALTGGKSTVIGAADADTLIVSARRCVAPGDAGGIGLWLVSGDAPGLSIRPYGIAQGGQAADLSLEGVEGEPLFDDALPAIEAAIAAATVALCAETLGAMGTATAMTRDYLTQRQQFGKPIGTFQVLRHRLADTMLEIEQARSIVILAAEHLEDAPQSRDRHVSAAKNLLGRAGRFVAEEAIQMHGGIGMTEEYALGRFAKRIVMADHRFGDTDYHLERFIALSA